MAAGPLVDPALWNAGNPVLDKDRIRAMIPQRFEMEQLDGIGYVDTESGLVAGWKDVREDEFWVRGHIPGRPLLPGVIMLEALAQLTSCAAVLTYPDIGFIGFGGIDACKFRVSVQPGSRLVLLAQVVDIRPRRAIYDTQGWLGDRLAVEARITGVRV